jgi:hypothetical protein
VRANSEAELFKTIPDLDDLEHFKTADDSSVVITVRGLVKWFQKMQIVL